MAPKPFVMQPSGFGHLLFKSCPSLASPKYIAQEITSPNIQGSAGGALALSSSPENRYIQKLQVFEGSLRGMLHIYLQFLSLQDDSTTCPASTSIILYNHNYEIFLNSQVIQQTQLTQARQMQCFVHIIALRMIQIYINKL